MEKYLDWKDFVKKYDWSNRFRSYGKALIIPRKYVLIGVSVLCFLTPGTNWIVIFLSKLIKNDLIIRWL